MKRRRFVFARAVTAAEVEKSWSAEAREQHLRDYPLRFFAGYDALGRVITRSDLCGDVHFFYESPLMQRREAELSSRGFRAREILVVDVEAGRSSA